MVEQATQIGFAFVAVACLWFIGTGLVAWAGNRPRATFGRSLTVAGFAGLWGLGVVVLSSRYATSAAAIAGLGGAIAIWGWHELSFLSGAVTGPRRTPCPPGLTGFARFRAATGSVIHHEIALAVTLALLASLSWNAVNPIGAQVFALLFVMRLSAKLAIYTGAPNFDDGLLPPQLEHLRSYFGPRRFHPALPVLTLGAVALAVWLGMRLYEAPAGPAATGSALLFALAALGALEHLFLIIPMRDAALWRWALPQRTVMQTMPGETTNGL